MADKLTDERKAAISRLINRGRSELQAWAWRILRTDYPDMATMVAEDPSVLDVVAAYVTGLEAITANVPDREMAAAVRSAVNPLRAHDEKSDPHECGATRILRDLREIMGLKPDISVIEAAKAMVAAGATQPMSPNTVPR